MSTAQQALLASGKSAHLSNVHNISLNTFSGNIKVHLYKDHHIDIDDDDKRDKAQTLLDNWCSKDGAACNSQRDLNREILLWFAEDLEPFNTVEKPGIQKFMQKNCGIQLPDRSTLARAPLLDMYKAVKQNFMEHFQSVNSVTLMYDGWTDKYRKMPFFGIRATIVDNNWNLNTYTLSCIPVENHTALVIKNHIKEVVSEFFKRRTDQIKLHCVHDGAANMMKASALLSIADPQHCMAHTMHLLISDDGMKKTPGVQNLLEKVRNIISHLTYKSYAISNDAMYKTDIAVYDKLRRLAEANEFINLEEQFPYEVQDDYATDCDSEDNEFIEVKDSKSKSLYRTHCHITLKMQVITRWNSGLYMCESLKDLFDCTMNMLKISGRLDLMLDDDEHILLNQLVTFLSPFKELTDIVSDATNSLSIIPICKARIIDNCKNNADDVSDIKALKKAIKTNIEKRFKLPQTAKVSCMFDPSVHVIFDRQEVMDTLLSCCPNETDNGSENQLQNNVNVSLQMTATTTSSESDIGPISKK